MQLSVPTHPFDQIDYGEADWCVSEDIQDDPEFPPVVGDTVYIVVARYGTGDTFGSSGGQMAYMVATKDLDKAKKLVANPGLMRPHEGAFLPWEGYFEWLQDLYVYTGVVEA